SQSNQDETSQSASSESESKSTEKDTKVVSQQHQASAVVQNISSTSIDSRTNYRNDSLSQIKNEAKNESLAQSPFSAVQSPNSAVQRVNIQPRSAQGYSGFRAAGDSTANSNVLPKRDKSKPFTERSKVSKVFVNRGEGGNSRNTPIFSKTVVYSDGHTMEVFNLITIDNPNTQAVEKNGWPINQQNKSIQNVWTANNDRGKLKLGSGFGTPTIHQGVWDVSNNTWFQGNSAKKAYGNATNGYWWDTTYFTKALAEKGLGVAAWIQVPINDPNGDLSYSFHPNGTYKDGIFNTHTSDFFGSVFLKGNDPYYTWINSPEGRASASQSTSEVKASESRSRSTEQSIADSRSQSISDSESRVKSQSVSTSESISTEKSKSISTSESISTAKSKSISTSESIVKSESESTAKSRSISTSQSIAKSKSASTAKSKSISTSQSIAKSKAASTAKSKSISTSQSIAKSKSASTAKSRSISTSQSIADSKAASTAKSRSISTSQSIADSKAASTSKSRSISTSQSIADSKSASTAKSRSISTSQSIADSKAASTSKSRSISTS
ncbi:hypothetical protein O0G68_11610, partial [Staphylococcus delphini]|nr:hypothetical protein [Staphylococcus delphini]